MGMILLSDKAQDNVTKVKALMKKNGESGYSYSGAINYVMKILPEDFQKELDKVTQKEIDEVKAVKGQEHNVDNSE